ncbi:hypothetical protein GYMLUDRAFT_253089 [Collybiopsis luxurians FD-317 M1]|uniref:Uncharacterized protein n=1 Tax=Collybiopsis luxurians FD-317 M1 TaxID=944289 RepID=A0A0D0BLL7_9AGAR|nr:hypothetical protein GYMLUDRAFT_253089 [Collybiopsis luxurians FD-317 M1]
MPDLAEYAMDSPTPPPTFSPVPSLNLPPSLSRRPSLSPPSYRAPSPPPTLSSEVVRGSSDEDVEAILLSCLPHIMEAHQVLDSLEGDDFDVACEAVNMVNVQPMEIVITRSNELSYREYEDYTAGYKYDDPEDSELKASIQSSNDGKCYVVPIDRKSKYLSGQLTLSIVPPAYLPPVFNDLKCYSIGLRHLLPETVGPGTYIPAGPQNRRAMVLAHFHRQGRFHYVVCIHGLFDVFLLRVHEFGMTKEWIHWDDVAAAFGDTIFKALFSPGSETLSERAAGMRNFRAAVLRHARGNCERDKKGLWDDLKKFWFSMSIVWNEGFVNMKDTGRQITALVRYPANQDGDPEYQSQSKMISEYMIRSSRPSKTISRGTTFPGTFNAKTEALYSFLLSLVLILMYRASLYHHHSRHSSNKGTVLNPPLNSNAVVVLRRSSARRQQQQLQLFPFHAVKTGELVSSGKFGRSRQEHGTG